MSVYDRHAAMMAILRAESRTRGEGNSAGAPTHFIETQVDTVQDLIEETDWCRVEDHDSYPIMHGEARALAQLIVAALPKEITEEQIDLGIRRFLGIDKGWPKESSVYIKTQRALFRDAVEVTLNQKDKHE